MNYFPFYSSDLRRRWTHPSDQRRLFHHHRFDAGCSCGGCSCGSSCTSNLLSSAAASSQEKLPLLSKNPKVESAFAFVSFPRPPHLQSAFTGHCAVIADSMFATFLVLLLLLLGTVIAKAKKKRLPDVRSLHRKLFFQVIEQEQAVVMVEDGGAVALDHSPEAILHVNDAEEEVVVKIEVEEAPALDEGDEVEEEQAPVLDEGDDKEESNEDDDDSIFRGMFDDNGDLFEDFDDWIVEDDEDESNLIFAFDDEGRLYHGGDDFYIHMNALLLDEFLHRHDVEASPHVVACVPDELEDSDGEDGIILIPNDTGN